MKFKENDYLNYCMVDLSDDKGTKVLKEDKYYAYNPDCINDKLGHNVLFVHGYNCDFFDVLEGNISYFEKLSKLRKGKRENHIAVYWPGNTKVKFGKAVKQAGVAAGNLANLMAYIYKNTATKNPHFTIIAHSLGNGISAMAITILAEKYKIRPVKNFIQLAPAIPANSYNDDKNAQFPNVPKYVENIKLYYSIKDDVLSNCYDLWTSVLRRKGSKKYDALGLRGTYGKKYGNIEEIDATKLVKTEVNHGTYLTNDTLVKSVSDKF